MPAIIPLEVQGVAFWTYLDTRSGRDFISSDAVKKLKLSPIHHESRQIVTVNGVKKQSLPLQEVTLNSLESQAREKVEIIRTKMPDFTVVKRPTVKELKEKYEHAENKKFYMTANDEYPNHLK